MCFEDEKKQHAELTLENVNKKIEQILSSMDNNQIKSIIEFGEINARLSRLEEKQKTELANYRDIGMATTTFLMTYGFCSIFLDLYSSGKK